MVALQDEAEVSHPEPAPVGGSLAMELRGFVQDAANDEVEAGLVRFVGFVNEGGIG